MAKFQEAYKQLNPAQKRAVDVIDGPLMVIAGPGTGKTQLLSTRVAHIIKSGAAAPKDILCLTFTEAGASNMLNRLIELIGEEAYHINVHTFHSFGLDVLGRYPEYFIDYLGYKPIDSVSGYELIEKLISKLPKSSPLASVNPEGRFTWQAGIEKAISDLKKAGLTPDEFKLIINDTYNFLKHWQDKFNAAFAGTWRGKTRQEIILRLSKLVSKIESTPSSAKPIKQFEPIRQTLIKTLNLAILNEVDVRSWRQDWLEGKDGSRSFKFVASYDKYLSLYELYRDYNNALRDAQTYDYNDMIMLVSAEMSRNTQLAGELQEKYLYILVDEFQDTNDAQINLLTLLTRTSANGELPNIMVVGDDDQAIYRFQGAEAHNLLEFKASFSAINMEVLTENYRSTKKILEASRHIIEFGDKRLENLVPALDKHLEAKTSEVGKVEVVSLSDRVSENGWIGRKIDELVKFGTVPKEIAVIAREHKHLVALMPHIKQPINYIKRSDVLKTKHIQQLICISRAVSALSSHDNDSLDPLIGEIISYDFFGIEVRDIWKFVEATRKTKVSWFDALLDSDNPKLKDVALLLGELARREPLETAEQLMDLIIGNQPVELIGTDRTMLSPFKEFYFHEKKLADSAGEYLETLSSLNVLRKIFRQWRKAGETGLRDFVRFIDIVERGGIEIADTSELREDTAAINLLTAHAAKGLEFEVVFILHATQDVWDKNKARSTTIKWPKNLPITQADVDEDDSARLFYVAATRAKRQLYFGTYRTLDSGKVAIPLRFLGEKDGQKPASLEPNVIKDEPSIELAKSLSDDWRARHLKEVVNLKAALQQRLDEYTLSPTDLNAFLNTSAGGPKAFFVNNFLDFPSAKSSSQSFGTAFHSVLKHAYSKNMSLSALKSLFSAELMQEGLNEVEFKRENEHGLKMIEAYFKSVKPGPSDAIKVETGFSKEGVVVNGAKLSGRLDMIRLTSGKWDSGGELEVIDFKTGDPKNAWEKTPRNRGLFNARQQLLFYKLLVENSKTFAKRFTVTSAGLEYVAAPLENKQLRLMIDYTQDELEKFQKLIGVVWQKIMKLEFEDTSHYSADTKGTLAFIRDLLN